MTHDEARLVARYGPIHPAAVSIPGHKVIRERWWHRFRFDVFFVYVAALLTLAVFVVSSSAVQYLAGANVIALLVVRALIRPRKSG